ncbi:MAG: class F sortase [Nocardioides sp.]
MLVVIALGSLATGCAPVGGADPDRTRRIGVGASVDAPTPMAVAPPESVSVPARGIDARLDPLELDSDGVLTPPAYGRAGWYSDGPEPGESGAAVIAGHLDSRAGPDVFAALSRVRPGDRIVIHRTDRTVVRFQVTRVKQYPQGRFPSRQVYADTEHAELRMITCAGAYDRTEGRYTNNLVVFATTE